MQFVHILKQNFANCGNHPVVFTDGNAMNQHVSAADPLDLRQLRPAGADDNVHPYVFNHFGHMPPDNFPGIHLQKSGIRVVQHDNFPVGIHKNNPLIGALKSRFNQLLPFPQPEKLLSELLKIVAFCFHSRTTSISG